MRNNMSVISHLLCLTDSAPSDFLCLSDWRCHHFDTTKVVKVELWAVLNTTAEHNFQDAFKNLQKCWEGCIPMEGDHSERDDGQ
jgi:hypothetical protein